MRGILDGVVACVGPTISQAGGGAGSSKKLSIRENKNGRKKTEVYDPPIIDTARGPGRAVDATYRMGGIR